MGLPRQRRQIAARVPKPGDDENRHDSASKRPDRQEMQPCGGRDGKTEPCRPERQKSRAGKGVAKAEQQHLGPEDRTPDEPFGQPVEKRRTGRKR
ncbi:hypothetical protein D3C71_1064790 [compost metagenome]